MTATSGRSSAELLHKKDPLGAFSRMITGPRRIGARRGALCSTKLRKLRLQDVYCSSLQCRCPAQTRSKLHCCQHNDTRQPASQGFRQNDRDEPRHYIGGYARMWATPAAADSKGTTGGGQGKTCEPTSRYGRRREPASGKAWGHLGARATIIGWKKGIWTRLCRKSDR